MPKVLANGEGNPELDPMTPRPLLVPLSADASVNVTPCLLADFLSISLAGIMGEETCPHHLSLSWVPGAYILPDEIPLMPSTALPSGVITKQPPPGQGLAHVSTCVRKRAAFSRWKSKIHSFNKTGEIII